MEWLSILLPLIATLRCLPQDSYVISSLLLQRRLKISGDNHQEKKGGEIKIKQHVGENEILRNGGKWVWRQLYFPDSHTTRCFTLCTNSPLRLAQAFVMKTKTTTRLAPFLPREKCMVKMDSSLCFATECSLKTAARILRCLVLINSVNC